MNNYKLGCIPSPPDERDYRISKATIVKKEFPLEFKLVQGIIKNQEDIGSCVAHSSSTIKEILEKKQTNFQDLFSVGYIYGNRDPEDFQEEGMYPRQALKCLKDHGIVTYSDFPYNIEYPQIKQTLTNQKIEDLKVKAYPYRISGYVRLYATDEIKTALMELGPVLLAVPIYESFYQTKSDGIVKLPNSKTEKDYGGHAMVIIGWTQTNKWIVQNSWGTGWGNKGLCYLDFKYPIYETWSVADNIIEGDGNKMEIKLQINSDKYTVNGIENTMDTKAIINEANRTMVPVRFIAEALGCQVEFDDKNKEVIITK